MARSIAPGRLWATLLAFGLLWPLVTVFNTAAAIHRLPYYSPPWSVSFKAAIAGAAIAAPELFITAAVFVSLALMTFTFLDRRGSLAVGKLAVPGKLAEPLLLLTTSYVGAGAWYPAAFAQPVLGDILLLPVGVLIVLAITLAAVLSGIAGRQGKRRQVFLVLILVGVSLPAASVVANTIARSGTPPKVLILGLDSLSYDETAIAREWIETQGGTVYKKAVTPALLTNAVWASVLAADYPSRHGVTQTFQRIPPESSTLLQQATKHGFRTIGRFPDQLTCSAGSDAGFEENLSGPVGWRQLILPLVHNGSLLVALVRPLLPRAGIFASPPNMAGSFSFSLEREIDELLHPRASGQTLVAGHITYMHFPAYPRTADLTWRDMTRLLVAQVRGVRDRTFDWTDADRPSDPIPVHEWKRQRLLHVVVEALDRSGVAKSGSRVVLFSDHGERLGLNRLTVEDPKYHHVLLATMNVPPRESESPRSLVDIGFLLGLASPHPDTPRVEFSVFPTELWKELFATAQLEWSGKVILNANVAAKAGPPVVFDPWR